MNDFPQKWTIDICNSLNKSEINPPNNNGDGIWSEKCFDGNIDFIKSYITYSSSIYEYLNSKNLINKGICPITGSEIGYSYSYELFGRKVYLSKEGLEQFKEWDKKEHLKLFGKEPLSQSERNQKIEDFKLAKKERTNRRLILVVLSVILIIYLLKKC